MYDDLNSQKKDHLKLTINMHLKVIHDKSVS